MQVFRVGDCTHVSQEERFEVGDGCGTKGPCEAYEFGMFPRSNVAAATPSSAEPALGLELVLRASQL